MDGQGESMLDRARDAYEYYSGKASDLVRQLGFAGIAVVWAFRIDDGGREVVPSDLRWTTALIVVALGLDLLQYVAGALIWGAFARRRELRGDPDSDAPARMNWGTLILFWGKIILMTGAYVSLLWFLWGEVS